MTQLDLLSYPASPGFKREGTSQQAAEAIKPSAATLREACLLRLALSYGHGLTTDECADAMGESCLSVRPRFSELRAMNLIEDTGSRRKNASGRNAVVWRLTETRSNAAPSAGNAS